MITDATIRSCSTLSPFIGFPSLTKKRSIFFHHQMMKTNRHQQNPTERTTIKQEKTLFFSFKRPEEVEEKKNQQSSTIYIIDIYIYCLCACLCLCLRDVSHLPVAIAVHSACSGSRSSRSYAFIPSLYIHTHTFDTRPKFFLHMSIIISSCIQLKFILFILLLVLFSPLFLIVSLFFHSHTCTQRTAQSYVFHFFEF